MKLDTLEVKDIQCTLDKIKEKSEQENEYKLIFHPNIITYDLDIVRSWNDYIRRDKHNRLVYHARKMLGYDVNQTYINFLDKIQ